MSNQNNTQLLIQEIAAIEHMERGKISIVRQNSQCPLYNHQTWENGKNVSRYVPRDQVPPLQKAIDGYHQFQELTEQYAQQVIEKTRAELSRAQELLKDQVEQFIAQARVECLGKSNAQAVEKELGYFLNNVSRMQYGTFRSRGFFIGSGVIEAGCKTVIGARCKQSGMFWGRAGAENILALRCIDASRRLDEFWKCRLNTHASLNDALPLAA